MLLTLRLWRALINDRGVMPVFRDSYLAYRFTTQTTSGKFTEPRVSLRQRLRQLGLRMLVVMGLLPLGCMAVFCVVPLLALWAAGSSLYYGLALAAEVTDWIVDEHESRTLDLLCVTPPGIFGILWSMCARVLQRHEYLRATYQLLSTLSMTVVLVVVVFGGVLLAHLYTISQPLDGLYALVSLLALVATFYLNFMQSMVLGALVGMLMPTYTRNRLDAPVLAGLTLLSTLTGTLLAAVFLCLWTIPALYTLLGFHTGVMSLTQPVIQLLVFYLMREGVTRYLWRMLTNRLNIALAEIDMILTPAVS